jgi:hypothetical protein
VEISSCSHRIETTNLGDFLGEESHRFISAEEIKAEEISRIFPRHMKISLHVRSYILKRKYVRTFFIGCCSIKTKNSLSPPSILKTIHMFDC